MWSSPDSPQSPRSLCSTLGLALTLAVTLAVFLTATPARCDPLRVAARPAASTAASQDWAWLSRWWSGVERWAGGCVSGLLSPTPNLGPRAESSAADTGPAPGSGNGGGRKSDSGRDPNG